jgi:hypothetical protein
MLAIHSCLTVHVLVLILDYLYLFVHFMLFLAMIIPGQRTNQPRARDVPTCESITHNATMKAIT